jgi:hypothetical protein
MPRKRPRKLPANDNQTQQDEGTACDRPETDHPAVEPQIATLDFAGQLFVWGVRSWVQALKARQDFNRVAGDAFARFNLAPSAAALEDLMTMIAASAARMIDIRCIRCPALSPDEAILIAALASAQRNEYFMATLLLRKMLPGTAARIALPHLVDLARDLAAAKMLIHALPTPSRDGAFPQTSDIAVRQRTLH